MGLIRLERLTSEIGHPRGHLLKHLNSPQQDYHIDLLGIGGKELSSIPNLIKSVPNGYYYVGQKIDEIDELLVKISDTSKYVYIDEYAKRHIVSSSIKNIITDKKDLSDLAEEFDEHQDTIRVNSIMYIYYYYCIFTTWIKEEHKTEKQIIEGVCTLLYDTISTLINKQNTLYKDVNIDSYIDILQTRLKLERLSLFSSDERTLNLREFI